MNVAAKKTKRIMLVGGGSGGHFYPLMAIAERLLDKQDENLELYFIGPKPYNKDNLTALNIRYIYCPAGKQRKYASVLNFFDKFLVLAGVVVATVKLFWIYPDVIMSKGSFTSVPVVLAAAFLRIPIVIHESDAVAGRANQLGAKFARYIGVSYDDAAEMFPKKKVALVGIPVRKAFFNEDPNPLGTLGITDAHPVLFVTGGSLGAERLNTLILDSLDELLPNFLIVHQAGAELKDAVVATALARGIDSTLLGRYFVFGHMKAEEMAAAYSSSTLVIARAGSTSITEIALNSKPCILIPIPETISHDQRTNAYAYAKSGAASVLEEENLTDGLLAAEISRITSSETTYQQMATAAQSFTSPTAASTLADTLIAITYEH